MITAYLSLGSNLGDRNAQLQQALSKLAPEVQVILQSSIYETEPQDLADQPWFLNMVVEVATDLSPQELLAKTQRVEAEMGRERLIPKGPRTIDIDILLYGDHTISTDTLKIPHPRMDERRFVLEPLAEIAPTQANLNLLSKIRGQKLFQHSK